MSKKLKSRLTMPPKVPFRLIGDLRRNLEAGLDLSAAMALHPKVFDNFYVAMVRVGEASGQLEEVFKRLAEHLLFETGMRQQVNSDDLCRALRRKNMHHIVIDVDLGHDALPGKLQVDAVRRLRKCQHTR